VQRFDGFVAKYMGDGALIYFGYPQAHEDDAERAVTVPQCGGAGRAKDHGPLLVIKWRARPKKRAAGWAF
jgi:class 3 adenylate cyclase